MSTAPIAFTGISSFSNDFQTILTRAVSIASLPLKQLQNSDNDAIQKKLLLGNLSSSISDLANSLSSLGAVSSGNALSATTSNSALATISNTGATSGASYTISSITSLATAANETSASGYADSLTAPVSSTGTVKLVIGSTSYTINLTPQTNNLLGLENAINQLGAPVTANILTTGTGATPNYLTLSATTTGATNLQLFNDPTGANNNLVTSLNQGTNANFLLNGVAVSRSSNTINDLVGGAIFTINGITTGTQTATLALAPDRSQFTSPIQAFVAKYNNLVDQVNGQVGSAAGLLTGDPIVVQLQGALRGLLTYQGSGTIKNLSDLGIQSDSSGKLSFDSTALSAFSDSQVTNAFKFFGSATSGFGGLSSSFTQLSDPVTGFIKTEQDNYDKRDKNLQTQIGSLNTRISNMQAGLTAQLQAADAQIAELTNQQSVLSGELQSLSLVLFGKKS